ncbi:2-oxoglutarate dehydrogenase E1 component [Coemansia javaensis]|uniref:2-oxoglutarate dehydrogenase E1 component n=1 Tax=Coemansia javaensis TaxID=2761396 RepID=A0A9W8HFD1_9FUNG|nr:2-oxoglutarate dehydrogenase E1 component [Coemansia javaensis]
MSEHGAKEHGAYDDFTQLDRALKKSGLYCKDMTGDGNCMFRALADQVDGTPDTHARHRESVCEYMARHEDEFSPFMDESCPFDRYTENMRRAGVFGGNLELVAFARNYRVDIKVYQVGGRVFVISGAPPSAPTDPNRSMPAVHIAYHSYEHYSSVRNRSGPHAGLPNVKASSNEKRLFARILNGSVEQPVVEEPCDLHALMREAMIPKPEACQDNSDSDADDDDDNDADGAEPSSREKMVMGSTGVANLRLVHRLLAAHGYDEGRVVELLIDWMASDHADGGQWWAEDGPADYNGPPQDAPLDHSEPQEPQEAQTGPDAKEAPSANGGPASGKDGAPEARSDDNADDDSDDNEDNEDTAAKAPARPARPARTKGGARQRKADSKKRRKEMAKERKRRAGREEVAASNGSAHAEANAIAPRLQHIYI